MTGHVFSSPWRSLLMLVLEAMAVMGTPGPSTMAVTASGAAFGVRQSLGFATGTIAGTVAVLLAVATGVVALLLSIPGLGAGLTLASAVYIIYLALKIATTPPLAKQTTGASAPSLPRGFCSRSPIPRRGLRSPPCSPARRWLNPLANGMRCSRLLSLPQ